MLMRIRLAIPLAFALFLTDCASKELAEDFLTPAHIAHPVIGNVVRFTLAYNNGAAMSLPIGNNARWPLILVSAAMVAVLARYVMRRRGSVLMQVATGLVFGGALGNLASRVMSTRGVIDFIDVGVGTHRFYVFNVADIGVCVGVCLLMLAARRAERQAAA